MIEEFVPYKLRAPQTDDLHELREQLSIQQELHGARSFEAQGAFELLFEASVRVGRPLDALHKFSRVEVERFFAQTRNGTDGHVYWLGAKGGFTRNDGKTRKAIRWWWEHLHGEIPQTIDVLPTCSQPTCINPAHCMAGRIARRIAFTEEQMIGTMQVAAMRLGHAPSSTEWRKNHYTPVPAVYRLRFGSWEKALNAAGLKPDYPGRGRKATPELARQSIREARRFLGHIPGYEEYRQPELNEHLKDLRLLTSPTTVRRQIGPTWQDAIRNALQ